jgi:hypothetical protein
MPLEQAQGVAIRCVEKVGKKSAQLDSVLNNVGIKNEERVKLLRQEIVHEDGGVRREGYTMKTAQLASIEPSSTVDDVAGKIHSNAKPRKDKDKAGK